MKQLGYTERIADIQHDELETLILELDPRTFTLYTAQEIFDHLDHVVTHRAS